MDDKGTVFEKITIPVHGPDEAVGKFGPLKTVLSVITAIYGSEVRVLRSAENCSLTMLCTGI